MLKGYAKDEYGIIYQVDPQEYEYSEAYLDTYQTPEYTQNAERLALLRWAHLVGAYGRPENVLEIGYGAGHFLDLASNYTKAYGYEIIQSAEPPKGARRINWQDMQAQYEMVCFFDSLEHMPSISWVRNLNARVLVISVPECHYISDKWFKNWHHRKPDEHIWHFNLSSLKSWLNDAGWALSRWSNIEDVIRKPRDNRGNILTAVFEKKSF